MKSVASPKTPALEEDRKVRESEWKKAPEECVCSVVSIQYMIMLMVMICSDATDGDECVTKDPMAARSEALEIEGIEQEPRLWVPELNYLEGFFTFYQ